MITELQDQIQKAVAHLRKEFSGLQVGRANVSLIEDIQIESYGARMGLRAVANISCPDSKTIKIEPWDKSHVSVIEKAILESRTGLNPQNKGLYLFLPIPPLTEERRKQLVKVVYELAEKAKISIRNLRHETLKFIKMQKDEGEISEDKQKEMEKKVQEKVDKANKEIDEIAKNKEKDILTI